MEDHSSATESIRDGYPPLHMVYGQQVHYPGPPTLQIPMYSYDMATPMSYRVDADVHSTDDLDSKRRQAAELLSRIESEFTEFKDRLYQQKMTTVRKEIEDLLEDRHVELGEQLHQLAKKRQDKLQHAEQWREYQIKCINKRYQAEKEQAENEFVYDKQTLRDKFLERLYETQRKLEEERHSADIALESSLSPSRETMTRKLRRRGLESTNLTLLQAKKKAINGPQLQLVLADTEIQDDLYAFQRGFVPKSVMQAVVKQPVIKKNESLHDVYFENGYLMYDRIRFMKQEDLIIDTQNGESCVAQITTINANEVWVKKRDNCKTKLYISQLRLGKYSIRPMAM